MISDIMEVEVNKTMEENYKCCKEYLDTEKVYEMMQLLLSDNLAPHIRLQYIYNVRQVFPTLPLEDVCRNKLEVLVASNFKQYGQVLEQLLKSQDLLELNIHNKLPIQQCADYLRPIPTILPTCCEHFQMSSCPILVWDYNINPFQLFRYLLAQAQTAKLQPSDSQMLLNLYKIEYTIDPNQFKALVEFNPSLVSQILTKLYQSKANIHEYLCPPPSRYLDYLIQIKVSIQSLEIVNQLSKSVNLPDQFLNMFITKCIEICEESKNNPQTGTRHVRLVAAFIKTLIKQKTFDPKKIYVELQGFCLEFQNIQEAQQLFKVIKNAAQE